MGRRQTIGVLADDEVALLEPHHPLRLDAEGRDAEVRPGGEQRVPQSLAGHRRHVHLVAQFADETDAQHAGRNTGDVAFTDA